MTEFTPEKWGDIPQQARQVEKIANRSSTYFQDVVYQFTRRKTAVVSLAAVVLLILVAVFGPMLTPVSYDAQNLAHVNTPPRLRTYSVNEKYFFVTSNVKLAEVAPDGTLLGTLPRIRDDAANKRFEYEIDGAIFGRHFVD